MAAVRARRAGTPEERPGAARASRPPLTLAHLITIVQDIVGPEDDGLVVATVRHLLWPGGSRGARTEPDGAPDSRSMGRR